MGKLSSADVLAGDRAAVNATLREARQLWSRASKAEVIEDALEQVERLVKGGQDEGVALRTQFRQLAKNKKTMRGFTKDQQALIEKVARGTGQRLGEALEDIGRIRDAVIGGGLASVVFGPVPGALTAAGQIGLRFLGRGLRARSARSAAQEARSFAAAGTLPPMTPSARARAFGQAATFGAGLTVGRSQGVEN